jgi:glycyl-tRNA synthetase beta chain
MADFPARTAVEEIPARMQARARNDLARMFAEQMERRARTAAIDVHSTPRRLACDRARASPSSTAGESRGDQGTAQLRAAAA